MLARGRSRQISTAAEARKASEERLARRRRQVPSVVVNTNLPPIPHAHARSNQVHCPSGLSAQRYTQRSEIFASAAEDVPKSNTTMWTAMHPPSRMPSASSSSSSLSSSFSMAGTDPDFDYFYCDSPPSPPHTIEDQLHVAYAHDDIHLAKILLLKLKGIEVSSDDDPRIAAVQEEDFDMCFLPHGALLTDEEEQKAKEAQRLEHEKRERQMWERRCQRIWENEKLRLREEKLRIQTAKLKAEEQRRRRVQQELESRQRAALKRSRKPKLSYSSLASGSSSSLSLTTPPLDLPPRRVKTQDDDFDSTSSVTFEEVLSSMNGALFPTERGHLRAGSSKSISTVKRGVKPDPLDVLLDPDISHYEPGQRRRQGSKASPCLLCSRTNSMSSSISSPISATSDDSDYSSASFSSFSSTFSDITTPSTSPESASNILLPKPTIPPIRRLPTSCHCRPPPTRLVAVTDHPLAESLPKPFASPQSQSISRRSSRNRQSPVRSRSISRLGRFLELAKSFQHAYMHAMVYSVMPTVDYADVPNQSETKVRMRRLLQPEGYRATAELVSMFISDLPPEPEANLTLSMYVSLDGERRTVLPYPLPYKTHFEPEMVPLPSPMQRFFHQKHLRNLRGQRAEQYIGGDPEEFAQFLKRPYKGTGGPQPRLRIIQNPMYMHLKAIRGAVAQRGESLDSPGLKKGPMANGTEKMLGFTTEWNRRSLLCPDIRL
ncbi:hypothetical protein BDZ89DRAFT_1071182 [Hymenopellis radicata]|nr:hypothetical protein BDZ89DRAFT_1071182 [Hymenopellis radicata]